MYKVTAKLPDGETVETNGTLEECILWADVFAADHPGVTINIFQVVGYCRQKWSNSR